MATEKTDFLRFNAYSMKELITRKLSEDSNFTDQVYEGSNLAILIDLVSYMYQCLVYQLNSAASESMFADTQIYENIQRLCKFIGYNVSGCSPASFAAQIQDLAANDGYDVADMTIPMYSRIDTGKMDRNGNKIYFSTAGKVNAESLGGNLTVNTSETSKNVNLYNGEWKLYGTVFTASGTENETFVLDGVQSDSSKEKYVPNNMINIVVRPVVGDIEVDEWHNDVNGIFLNYTNDESVFNDNVTNFYDANAQVYSVGLNSEKTYELKFGNGVVGKMLSKGDLVYVFYLESNGPDGDIQLNDIDFQQTRFEHNPGMFNLTDKLYKELFKLTDETVGTMDKFTYQIVPLQLATAKFVPEESVESIRTNAPQWFKMGNRLVTPSDYEYFIKNIVYVQQQISQIKIIDVKCMNNTQYISTFFKWLYLNGRDNHGSGRYYFQNQWFWNTTQYIQADPADANNTYIWLKSDSNGTVEDDYDVQTVEEQLSECLNPVKTMTTEIKLLKPVLVNFDVCANVDVKGLRTMFATTEGGETLAGADSYIEITMDDQRLFSGNQVQGMVRDIVLDYFKMERCRLGQIVSFDDIVKRIYGIQGVMQVNTVYVDSLSGSYRRLNGLSFVSWSPILRPPAGDEDGYDDLDVSSSTRKLEPFQFPVFIGANSLTGRIKVITKNTSRVNQVEQ